MSKKEVKYEALNQEIMVVKEEVLNTYEAERIFTYDEVKYWVTNNKRWELFQGIPMLMASPTPEHQLISKDLAYLFEHYLRGKKCQLFLPVDTVLSYKKGKDTYFIPDLVIVCDRNKLKRNGIFGAPDLVVEILSSSTSGRDRIEKRHHYEEAGIKEYWMVDPKRKSVEVALLDSNGKFNAKIYEKTDTIKISIFEDLSISVTDVFANPWLNETT